MKKGIIILILILPMTCEAHFGWAFTDYSLLAGQQYTFGQRPLWSIEFQYDKYSRSCISRTHYHGIGLNYNFNNYQSELGIKYMWNPTHLIILVSRSAKFYPYLFAQGGFIQLKRKEQIINENKKIHGYNFRPGVGLTGNFRENKVLSIRIYLQLGYNILIDNSQSFKNPLALEFKLGFGINTRQLKKNSQIELENDESEAKQ